MELHRLLELKSSMTNNINANNQCIFCVDIATNLMGSNFDSVHFACFFLFCSAIIISVFSVFSIVGCRGSFKFIKK